MKALSCTPCTSISNRRSRSSRNEFHAQPAQLDEHIESEIALKPERNSHGSAARSGAYRIGDRAQAGTNVSAIRVICESISNRRSRSSRNEAPRDAIPRREHIESEIALKPEQETESADESAGAYRIGDRAQAGTTRPICSAATLSISNRRSRSSRNYLEGAGCVSTEHIESEIALKPELHTGVTRARGGAYRIGDRAQAGTKINHAMPGGMSISNRRSRSSRNV